MRFSVPAFFVSVMVVGCGGGKPPPPPTPDPPQVFIVVPSSNVVGTSISAQVSVTGCDKVSNLALYNISPSGSDQFLKNVTFTGSPTTVTLQQNEIPYPVAGIAAHLSLKAQATCDDGRKSFSQPVAATFLPVASVVSNGVQLLPDSFVVDGAGANAIFTGCAGTGSAGGTQLVRVDVNGNVTATQPGIPYPCSFSSIITTRNNASGKRWLWEDGVGAFAFDANLNVTAASPSKASGLGVMPNGDGVIWNKNVLQGAISYVRVANNQVAWTGDITGQLAGAPVLRQNYGIYIPDLYLDTGTNQATFRIDEFAPPTASNFGAKTGQYDLVAWAYGTGDIPYIPQVTFSNDASIVYIPVPLSDGVTSEVWACASNGTGCSGVNQKWKSVDLPGPISIVVPFNKGTMLAAIGAKYLWFLAADTGAVLNAGGQAVQPDTGLVAMDLEVNPNGSDVYMLNGPPPRGIAGAPVPEPVEIVAIDAPQQGEVFRYSVDNQSLWAALDDSDTLWMRVGQDIVKALPMSDYRAVHPTQ